MIIKAYSDNNLLDLLFEMECDSVSPVSSYLIENNLKSAPEHYFDNSMLGYNTRINTKTTHNDIEIFKNSARLDKEIVLAMLEIESSGKVVITKELLESANDISISFFSNIYDNIKDEYRDEFEDVSMLELIL